MLELAARGNVISSISEPVCSKAIKKKLMEISPTKPRQNRNVGAPKKYVGIRQVVKGTTAKQTPGTYKHGMENPLIISLIQHNPRLLGQILSIRDPLLAMNSDYIISLLSSRGQNDPVRTRRKRNNNGAAAVIQQRKKMSDGKPAFLKSMDEIGEDVEEETMHTECSENEIMENIAKEEQKFLEDVIEETQLLRSRRGAHGDSHTGRTRTRMDFESTSISVSVDEMEAIGPKNKKESVPEIVLIKRQLQKEQQGVHCCEEDIVYASYDKEVQNDSIEGFYTDSARHCWDESEIDDLHWLTHEMEKEYEEFLQWTKPRTETSDRDDYQVGKKNYETNQGCRSTTNTNVLNVSKKAKPPLAQRAHGYKASMCLTRGPRCDLGIYDTAEEAARAYDMHVLARRTLGKKIVEEVQIRKRVKARRAAYIEMQKAVMIEGVTPQVAAQRALKAANAAFDAVKPDRYLTSEKVLYPELNCHSVLWDVSGGCAVGAVGRAGVPCDEEASKVAKAKTAEVWKTANAMLDGAMPGKALAGVLKDTILTNSEDEQTSTGPSKMGMITENPSLPNEAVDHNLESAPVLDQTIMHMKNELESLSTKIVRKSEEIARLIDLEKSTISLLKE